MPNWCECDLKVKGPAAQVREFMEFAAGEDCGEVLPLDFNKFVPYPAEYRERDNRFAVWLENPNLQLPIPEDGFNSGGNDWRIKNWGTQWNAARFAPVTERESHGKLIVLIAFSTAWSPPCPVILNAAERFPGLAFDLRYNEFLGGFCGRYVCRTGKVVHNKFRDYSDTRND